MKLGLPKIRSTLFLYGYECDILAFEKIKSTIKYLWDMNTCSLMISTYENYT